MFSSMRTDSTPIHKRLANQMGCSPDTVACHLHSLHGCRTHWIKVTNSSAPPSLPVCSLDARLLAETNGFHYWIVTRDKKMSLHQYKAEEKIVPTSKQHLESSQICIPATQWCASSQHNDLHPRITMICIPATQCSASWQHNDVHPRNTLICTLATQWCASDEFEKG